ncbi:MAG: C25 family cysteine peptidase [Candidatus Krumholzibacteriia bacterium]
MMMSRRWYILAGFAPAAMLLLFAAGSAAAADGGRILLEDGFAADDLRWETLADGSRVPHAPGAAARLLETGDPDLPARDLTFLIPLAESGARLEVEAVSVRRIQLPGPIAAAGPVTTDSGDAVSIDLLPADGHEFPAVWGEFRGQHTWRGYRLAAVRVHPIRLVRDGAGAFTEAEVLERYRVRLVSGSAPLPDIAQRRRLVPGERELCEAKLRRVVANPGALSGYAREDGIAVAEPVGFAPTAVPSLGGSAVNYLIITSAALAGEFQRLADHRTAQGRPAVVATIETIQDNYRNGVDVQETVRMFIRDAYENWGTEYVLLAGDTEVLPPRYVRSFFYPVNGHTDIPAELYFQCLDGNWNADGDAYFGEPYVSSTDRGDYADFADEVYLGRAPVINVAQAAVFVDKVIHWELAGPTDAWTNRMLFAAEVLFPDDFENDPTWWARDGAEFSEQTVTETLQPCSVAEYSRMYQNNTVYPGSVPLTLAAVIDSLNTGHYSLFNQIGHGYFFNMSVGNANFLTTDADALVNENPFLVYALNCASGAFDYSCLLERFIQNPNGGSVVSIGSARAAFPDNSNGYQQEYWRLLFCDEPNEAGRLLALSRLPFIGDTAYERTNRWTFLNYTLLGDPALQLWRAAPRATVVTAPSSVPAGQQAVAVTVQAGGSPVAGARVCLQKAGDDYGYALTDAAGVATIDYTPVSGGTITVTVSGKGLQRVTRAITVNPGARYVALEEMTVVDDGTSGSSGNGNGVPEAGETVVLNLVVRDTGGGGASGCNGYLTCATAGVTVVDGTASIGTVPAGGTSSVSAAFKLQLAADIPDGTEALCQLVVTDASAGNYESKWSPAITAPEVEVVGLEWSDVLHGDGDGIIDAGERLTVRVDLKNFGAGRADLVTGVLRSDDLGVTLHDSVVTYTGLELMQSSPGSGVFSLSQSDPGAQAVSRVVFTDTRGRRFVHDFHLQRPTPPTDVATDTSHGPGVIVLRWVPPAVAVRGYHVYRAEQESGPYARVNRDLLDGIAYFRDSGLNQLTRYYYRITSVDGTMVESSSSNTITQSTAPAELANFPAAFATESSSHPAVGDVTGDGRLEIVWGADQVYVIRDDGTELWNGDFDSQTLGPITDSPYIFEPAGITLANLDDDPQLEIVASLNNHRGSTYVNEIHVYNAEDGTQVPGWPKSLRPVSSGWNWSTPAVGDITGDGYPNVVVNTCDGRTWAWHRDGTEVRDGDNDPSTDGVFIQRAEGWNFSSPALFDLDGDGAKEIILGTTYYSENEEIVAYRYDGTQAPGFPYQTNAGFNLQFSPAVADLDGDGVHEIVICSIERRLFVVRQDGTDYPGFPITHGMPLGYSLDPAPSPAVGDFDGDGQLEIVWITQQNGGSLGVNRADLMVVDTDHVGGTSGQLLPGWPVILPGGSEGSPVVGDITGDGLLEIVHGVGGQSEETPDALHAYHHDGSTVDGFPISLGGPARSSAVICDLDFDGDVDLVLQAWDRLLHVWDMPYPYVSANMPWPTFGGNRQRDGVFDATGLVAADRDDVPRSLTVPRPYPNPFNPSTTVRLFVPGRGSDDGRLDLAVYDLKGRRIRTLHRGGIAEGWHTWTWDGRDDGGRDLSSGLYFLRAQTGERAVVHKMTLVK